MYGCYRIYPSIRFIVKCSILSRAINSINEGINVTYVLDYLVEVAAL